MERRSFKISNFQDFINENYAPEKTYNVPGSFRRFYMLVKKPYPIDSPHRLSRMIGEARNLLFDQVMIDDLNYKTLKFEAGVPILNFTDSGAVEKLLKEKIVDRVYNLPRESHKVSDKVVFHKTFDGSSFVPKTVFGAKDTASLKFPIIAKPAEGKSAKGIRKFDTQEDLKSCKDKFDVFCEAIDISDEYRCFCFRDQIIEINKRVKNSDVDFLKDSETVTDFIYQKVDDKKYKNIEKLKILLKECGKKVALEFYSVDFAEDSSGKLHLIEMNARTGMGSDKMTKLYRAIHQDYYNFPVSKETEKYLQEIDKDWVKSYKEEKNEPVYECTVVGGKLEDKMFLFKNRDRSYSPDSKIIIENFKNTEIVYYTDQTGWIEGMNEHGVGFVFSALSEKHYSGYDPSYYMTDEPKDDSKFKKFADRIKEVLISKTASEAVKRIEKSEKSGNFLVGDKNQIIELEIFKGEKIAKKVDLSGLIVKTNYGVLIPDAGHQPSGDSIKRGISGIRGYQAKLQLQGVTSINEIPTRMKFQAFDYRSPLNVFRTDVEENTISQCLMNLTDIVFYFFHDGNTANSVKFTEKLKNSKIRIDIR
jgi:hypothetical protein